MALPRFVFSTSHMSVSRTGIVTMTTMSFSHVYVAPWIEKTFPFGSTFGIAT